MHAIQQLLAFLGPRPLRFDDMGGARRLFLAALAFLVALLLVGLWGVAAGSVGGHFALVNAVSVPLLLLVSSAAALPVVLIVLRLTTVEGSATDLVLGHSAAVFGASLVLALLAPIVALYQYSSSWAGPVVALGSVFVAFAVGLGLLLRGLGKLMPEPRSRRGLVAPVVLLCALQGAALLQLAAIAPPVMPHRTVLGHGIDALAHTDTEAAP
jgi:hypothetical protein